MKPNDLDALFSAAESGDKEKIEKIGKSAASSLSREQRNNIEKALADPEYLKTLLSSPKAQELLKKFGGGKK